MKMPPQPYGFAVYGMPMNPPMRPAHTSFAIQPFSCPHIDTLLCRTLEEAVPGSTLETFIPNYGIMQT